MTALLALSAGTTTGGDWTMWVSLTALVVLGLVAVGAGRWFKTDPRDA